MDGLKVCFDKDYMRKMLKAEGFEGDQVGIDTCLNLKTETGFMSIRMEFGYPRLVHFLVEPDKRSFRNSLKQFQIFTDMMIAQGHPFFLVESPGNKREINRFIKFIGGDEPYMIANNDSVYCVPVGYRKKRKQLWLEIPLLKHRKCHHKKSSYKLSS